MDTVIITAGVISLQPLLSIANLKHESDHVGLEGVQRVVEVAQAALHSNFVGPLVSATTFVRESGLSRTYPFFQLSASDPLAALHIKFALDPAHVLIGLRDSGTYKVAICGNEIFLAAAI